MDPADLARMLELMAAALHAMPAGAVPAGVVPVGPQSVAPLPVQGRTLAEWLEVHERQVLAKGYKRQTIRNRTASIKHLRRLWGDRPITALRAHEIISALRREFLPDHTPTAQRTLAELRDAYNEAIANDWAETNPAAHVRLPAHRVKRRRLSLETWRQMRELARASRQRWLEALLLLALVTGQRRGDLAKMRFDDVADGCRTGNEKGDQGSHPLVAFGLHPLDRSAVFANVILGFTSKFSNLPERRAAEAGRQWIRREGLPGRRVAKPARGAQPVGAALQRAGRRRADAARPQHAEMTDLYRDDRGLSSAEWKRVAA